MHEDPLSLIFARHGRTAWNLSGRYQGSRNPALAAEGAAEAETLAARLRAEAPAAIFSSPLRRAVMTAGIVGARLGLDSIAIDSRLTEIAFGAWEGLTQAEVKQRWPDQLRQWKQAPDAARFPGGETLAEARLRLLAFLKDLAGVLGPGILKQGPGPVLVVGHGGLIRIAVLEAQGAPLAQFRSIEIEPGSFRRFVLTSAPDGTRLTLAEGDENKRDCSSA